MIHEALTRLLPIAGVPDASVVGGYWTRSNDPKVDIVGADRSPRAKRIAFTGTIKWRDNAPLDQTDIVKLVAVSARIPGVDASTSHLAVSRNGGQVAGVAAALGPDDLIRAWSPLAR